VCIYVCVCVYTYNKNKRAQGEKIRGRVKAVPLDELKESYAQKNDRERQTDRQREGEI
jgi:hypothetical protein